MASLSLASLFLGIPCLGNTNIGKRKSRSAQQQRGRKNKIAQAFLASAAPIPRSAEVEVRNNKEGRKIIAQARPDLILPAQIISTPLIITSTPMQLSVEETKEDIGEASSDLDESGDPKRQGSKGVQVPVQTLIR
jgi:hypothetical protein